METLEKRIRHLEDLTAIKRLKADYCAYADIWSGSEDRGTKFGALFAEDATWDVGHKVCIGPAQITEELMSLPKAWGLRIGIHLAVNPRIDIEGDEASGTWHFLIPTIPAGKLEPQWNCGVYFEKYVRTPKGWRFKQVRTETAFAPGV